MFARCVLFSFPPFLSKVAQISERPTAKLARNTVIEPKHCESKNRRSERTFRALREVAADWEKAGGYEWLFRFAARRARALFASCACARCSARSGIELRPVRPRVHR